MSKVFINNQDIQNLILALATKVLERESMLPDVVCPVMTGALFFSSDMLQMLNSLSPKFDPVIAPVQARKMPLATSPGHHSVGVDLGLPIIGGYVGRRILLLDTVCNTGETLLAVKRRIEEKSQVRSVQSAVLIFKNSKNQVYAPDYVGIDMKGSTADLSGYGLNNTNRSSPNVYF